MPRISADHAPDFGGEAGAGFGWCRPRVRAAQSHLRWVGLFETSRPPAAVRQRKPEEALLRRSARVVVEPGDPFVEAARVGRVSEPELLVVEVVTELVTEST